MTSPEFRRVLYNTTVWLTLIGVVRPHRAGPRCWRFLVTRTRSGGGGSRTLFHVVLIVPWATPPIVAVVIWRWMLDPRAGVVNKLLVGSGLAPSPWRSSPT